jgi:hypothetical protein
MPFWLQMPRATRFLAKRTKSDPAPMRGKRRWSAKRSGWFGLSQKAAARLLGLAAESGMSAMLAERSSNFRAIIGG